MQHTTRIHLPILLVALLLAAGSWACGGEGEADAITPSVTAGTDLDPAALGSLGARLHAAPDRTEAILTEAGLDYAQFEQAVRAVAADVEASRRYRESFEATRSDPLVRAAAEADPAG